MSEKYILDGAEFPVLVNTEIVERLGHFDTIEELNAKIDELWGPINRCEEEGSVPWFKVYHCQGKNLGFDLVTVTIADQNYNNQRPCYGR